MLFILRFAKLSSVQLLCLVLYRLWIGFYLKNDEFEAMNFECKLSNDTALTRPILLFIEEKRIARDAILQTMILLWATFLLALSRRT